MSLARDAEPIGFQIVRQIEARIWRIVAAGYGLTASRDFRVEMPRLSHRLSRLVAELRSPGAAKQAISKPAYLGRLNKMEPNIRDIIGRWNEAAVRTFIAVIDVDLRHADTTTSASPTNSPVVTTRSL